MTAADRAVMTPEEAAAYLRVNPQTVYRLLRRGTLPGVKIGRQWRIRRADLDAHFGAPRTAGPAGPVDRPTPSGE